VLLPTPAPYIGVIGSLHKMGRMLGDLSGDISPEDAARVRASIGLDLGGRRPAEIALAVLVEIELVRHGGSGRPCSEALPVLRGGREAQKEGAG